MPNEQNDIAASNVDEITGIMMEDEARDFKIACTLAGAGIIVASAGFYWNSPLLNSIALLPLTAGFVVGMWYIFHSYKQ